jgi:hypothetical protein
LGDALRPVGCRAGRRVLRPQVVHDLIQRHHPAGPYQERRQRGPLLAAAQLHPLAVAPCLDLAEQPELDQRPGRGLIVHRGGRGGRRPCADRDQLVYEPG